MSSETLGVYRGMAVDYFPLQFELQLVGGAVRIWFMGSQKLAPYSQIVENLSMVPVVVGEHIY